MKTAKPAVPGASRSSVRDGDIVTSRSLTRRTMLASAVAALVATPAAAQLRGSDRDVGPDSDPAHMGRGPSLTDADPDRDPPGFGQVGKRPPPQREQHCGDRDTGPDADISPRWCRPAR